MAVVMDSGPRSPGQGPGSLGRNDGEGRAVIASTRNERDLHLLVGELSALDDDVVVERDRAIAHRHVVVSLGRALAAALRVRAGGEEEISGKAARTGVVARRIGAVE